MYEYLVTEVRRVIDGDTYDLTLDMGFHASIDVRVRLLGVDTPEMRGPDREEGMRSTRAVQDWFTEYEQRGIQLTCRTIRTDSFGRWLCDIRAGTDDLASWLLEKGYAKEYGK